MYYDKNNETANLLRSRIKETIKAIRSNPGCEYYVSIFKNQWDQYKYYMLRVKRSQPPK